MVYEAMEWTFTWFWAVFGLANIGIGILTRGIPVWLEYILTGIFIVLWMIFFLCGSVDSLCDDISCSEKYEIHYYFRGTDSRERVTEALKEDLTVEFVISMRIQRRL